MLLFDGVMQINRIKHEQGLRLASANCKKNLLLIILRTYRSIIHKRFHAILEHVILHEHISDKISILLRKGII